MIPSYPVISFGVMGVLVAAMLYSEWKKNRKIYALTKTLGALLFLIVAFRDGITPGGPLLWIQIGFIAAALGDVLLIPRSKAVFKIGILAFLAGHLLYMIGIIQLPQKISLGSSLGVAAIYFFSFGVLIKLWNHLAQGFRPVVGAYVLVLSSLMAIALFANPLAEAWGPFAWATVFATSDLCVARQRFVHESIWNRMLGLPLYFGTQLYLAWQAANWG